MRDPRRLAVLISGRGSNLRALAEQARGYEVVLVASNKSHAPGLEWARSAGLPTWCWDRPGLAREQFDAALSQAFADHCVGTVALAGYMRLLSSEFVSQWTGRIVNIHPSLLPKYKGIGTHAQALEAGDSVHGCTVHLVTEELDSGKVLASAEVPVEPGDTPQSLEARVLAAEHKLYPAALAEFVSGSSSRGHPRDAR